MSIDPVSTNTQNPTMDALFEANRILMVARRPGGTGVPDEEAREFTRLADRMYKELDCPTGGPLHAELEDGNIDHMVGESADTKILEFINALRIIAEGNAPHESDYRFQWMYQLAHYYRERPDALRCAIAILEITRHWNEDDAELVYDRWSASMYGDDGWLARRRRGDADGRPQ